MDQYIQYIVHLCHHQRIADSHHVQPLPIENAKSHSLAVDMLSSAIKIVLAFDMNMVRLSRH